MRNFAIIALMSAATLGATGAAYAQGGRGGPALTRGEVEARSAQAFARMDVNSDGVLDPADRAAAQRKVFEGLDADGDGNVSFAEFSARREDRREHRAERRGGRGPGPGMRGGHGMARAADADNDGAISQAEFAGAALTRFDRVDADRDGTISADERRAMREQRREMRRDRRDG